MIEDPSEAYEVVGNLLIEMDWILGADFLPDPVKYPSPPPSSLPSRGRPISPEELAAQDERLERARRESPAGRAAAAWTEKVRESRAREARRIAEGRPYIINRDDEGNPIIDPHWTKEGLGGFGAPQRANLLTPEQQERAVRDVVNNPEVPLSVIAKRHRTNPQKLKEMCVARGVIRASNPPRGLGNDEDVSVNCELGAHERCTSCGCGCHRK